MINKLLTKFNECLNTWKDLPPYVYSNEYRAALIMYLDKRIEASGSGNVDEFLVVMILHHETEGIPYFEFDRSVNRRVRYKYTKYLNANGMTIRFNRLVEHKGYPGQFLVIYGSNIIGYVPKKPLRLLNTTRTGERKVATFSYYEEAEKDDKPTINKKDVSLKQILLEYDNGITKSVSKGVVITDDPEGEDDHNLTFEFADMSGMDLENIVYGVIQLGNTLNMFDSKELTEE